MSLLQSAADCCQANDIQMQTRLTQRAKTIYLTAQMLLAAGTTADDFNTCLSIACSRYQPVCLSGPFICICNFIRWPMLPRWLKQLGSKGPQCSDSEAEIVLSTLHYAKRVMLHNKCSDKHKLMAHTIICSLQHWMHNEQDRCKYHQTPDNCISFAGTAARWVMSWPAQNKGQHWLGCKVVLQSAICCDICTIIVSLKPVGSKHELMPS